MSEYLNIFTSLLNNNNTKENGTPAKSIQAKENFSLEEAKDYHQDLMELSNTAFNLPIENRSLHASTLSLDRNKIKEAKKTDSRFSNSL